MATSPILLAALVNSAVNPGRDINIPAAFDDAAGRHGIKIELSYTGYRVTNRQGERLTSAGAYVPVKAKGRDAIGRYQTYSVQLLNWLKANATTELVEATWKQTVAELTDPAGAV